MRYLFTLLILLLGWNAGAQKKNREYFQQEVNYQITVKLDDEAHTLSGFETIEYTNNAPHQLQVIYFHLWPNAYRNTQTAMAKQLLENGSTDFYYSDTQKGKGYIDSLLFVVNGDTVKWEYDSLHVDICKVFLKKPLNTHEKITITTPFFVKIPGNYSRLGHVGQSYQITQWFPKPAVYDHNGWNQMPYLTQGEFYSEFGSFDVRITLPENYVVAATGDLYESPEEEMWLEQRYRTTRQLIEEKRISKTGQLRGEWTDAFPPSSPQFKTVRYVQHNTHDFAWFADKRFYVLRSEYNLPKSGRNVALWSFFTRKNSRWWVKSGEYLHDAVKYYSQWIGEYPYNQVSAVDGTISAGGGMEYPTVTVIGDVNSDIALETVIVHEVGHNWFYGILGSNERVHPWLDEGLNSFNELRYLETKYPELSLIGSMGGNSFSGLERLFNAQDLPHKTLYELSYLVNARRNYDQPIELESDKYTPTNYGAIVYSKAALAFDYLRHYLGEKTFDKCMQAYYERWKFKHPQPEDLKAVFQEVSRKDLTWFFDNLIKHNEVIDYKLKRKKRVDRRSSKTYMWMKYEESLIVKNKTGMLAPFCIQGIRADTVAAEVWYPGFKGKKTINFPNGPYDYFKIDYRERIPEVNRHNNRLNERGLFKRTEKLRLQFLAGIDNPNRSTLYYSPALGWNQYDGLMLGLVLHNNIFPTRPFEWQLVPLYGFKSGQPAGYANFNYRLNTRKSDLFTHFRFGLSGASFASENSMGLEGFSKISPSVYTEFKPKSLRSPNRHALLLRSVYIDERYRTPENASSSTPASSSLFNEISYLFRNTHTLRPWNLTATVQQHTDFLKASIEANYQIRYDRKGRKLNLRLFAGNFFYNNTVNARYNWRMDGQNGYRDYTYDQVFPGRMEGNGFWRHQFIENHGGFKTPTAHGQSSNWLVALNLKSDLPIPLIKVFADAGISGDMRPGTAFLFDAGIYFSLGKVVEVYFPLAFSTRIQDEYDALGWKFGDRIRFTLNLNQLNPFTSVRNIKP